MNYLAIQFRSPVIALLNISVLLVASLTSHAEEVTKAPAAIESSSETSRSSTPASAPIVKIRSRHFVLQTDLDADTARTRLQSMERVLTLAADYWGQRLPGTIECFLVHDLKNWNEDKLPSPVVRRVLQHIGGGTDLELSTHPRQHLQTTIYATSSVGIVEHEVVHAYCFQSFGQGGPDWYREGMAEVFAQCVVDSDPSATHHQSLDLLKETPRLKVSQIVSLSMRTDQLRSSMASDLPREQTPAHSTVAHDPTAIQQTAWHWSSTEDDELRRAQIAYAQSWALCHLLVHNENYRQRFQALGRHWLTGHTTKFEEAFAPVLPHLDFELSHFVRYYETGFQANQVKWPWESVPRELPVGESVTIRVIPCRGYQATGIAVRQGQTYEMETSGSWQLNDVGPPVTACGDLKGRGRLEAALFDNFELTPLETFRFAEFAEDPSASSQWQAGDQGHLLFRCRDSWHELHDNRGTIRVRITRRN